MKIQGTLRVDQLRPATTGPNVRDYVLVTGELINLGRTHEQFSNGVLTFTVKRVNGRTPIEVGEHLRVTIDDEDET